MNASDTSHEAEAQINDQIPSDQPNADQANTGQPNAEQPNPGPTSSDQPNNSQPWQYHLGQPGSGPLYRPYDGRMVFGVCAGIAQYLNVDVNVVRIVFAVLTLIGGAGIPVYIAGWLLLPDEGAEQSIASEFIGSLQGRSR
ncbi:MAG TPA: PspC domain-containing protein [Streptosporangiaceae bacterium]|nr:PspC domain-containing protein [Streptosporangiaceae bacterium]